MCDHVIDFCIVHPSRDQFFMLSLAIVQNGFINKKPVLGTFVPISTTFLSI